MTHPIEQAADAVDRELADLRANLAQSAAGNNGLVELVKATQENNETLRAKLAVAVEALKTCVDGENDCSRGLDAARVALAQIKGEK